MFSASRLRVLMDTQGRKAEWLAEMTGYDASTVSRFMTGTYPISDKFAKLAARHLQVPVDWLRETVAVEPSAA